MDVGYPEVLRYIPSAFFVPSNEQLFAMFFPKGE